LPNISDMIEQYLKKMLAESRQNIIEIQRNELAAKFNCVPSQINYVLTTRFTVDNGFLVESRRGGGGYVRIVKIPLCRKTNLLEEVCRLVGSSVSQREAESIITRFLDEDLITNREAYIMRAAVDRRTLDVKLPLRDKLRANLLKVMLAQVLRDWADWA